VRNYITKNISKVNINELLNFYKEAFKLRDPIFFNNFKWFYRMGESNYEPIVIFEKGKIIAHAGLIPENIKYNNKNFKFIWFTDLVVLPEFRKTGFGEQIIKERMKTCENQITFCNDLSLQIFKKLQWKESYSTSRYIKPIFFDKFYFKKYLHKEDFKNLKIHKIDEKLIRDILPFEKKNNVQDFACFLRDEKWFEWKFLKCPFKTDILCFDYNSQYVLAFFDKRKKSRRLNILYSTEKSLQKSKIFKLIQIWAGEKNINLIWYVSHSKYSGDEIFSFITKKRINFAFKTKDKILNDVLKKGIINSQGGDSDIGYMGLL
tara:strand:- start:116 stop:1072 length:957 start_codon:yes stop_codon:yes gene_type:complete